MIESNMKSYLMISFILITTFASIDCKNNRPLIAIISQNSKDGQSLIVASYVKYLEGAGARIVPVLVNKNKEYYERMVNQTDGLLIPGGGENLQTSGYLKAGQMIWDYTRSGRLNRSYPMWGIGLGFQLLVTLVDPNLKLNDCNAEDVANKLTFTTLGKESPIFKDAQTIIDILEKQSVTYNHHKKCLSFANRTANFNQFFDVLTTTTDKNGLEYISSIESKNHHVYATQWHPEKNQFEFAFNKLRLEVPHSSDAVLIGQHMANFFVDQTRELSTRNTDESDENEILIYNYQPRYTGNDADYLHEQVYYFNTSRSNLWCVSFCYYIVFIFISLDL